MDFRNTANYVLDRVKEKIEDGSVYITWHYNPVLAIYTFRFQWVNDTPSAFTAHTVMHVDVEEYNFGERPPHVIVGELVKL